MKINARNSPSVIYLLLIVRGIQYVFTHTKSAWDILSKEYQLRSALLASRKIFPQYNVSVFIHAALHWWDVVLYIQPKWKLSQIKGKKLQHNHTMKFATHPKKNNKKKSCHACHEDSSSSQSGLINTMAGLWAWTVMTWQREEKEQMGEGGSKPSMWHEKNNIRG